MFDCDNVPSKRLKNSACDKLPESDCAVGAMGRRVGSVGSVRRACVQIAFSELLGLLKVILP